MAENISQVIDLGIDLNKLAEDFNKAKALAENFLATFAKPITIAQNLIDNSALTQNVNKAVDTIDRLGQIVTQFVSPLTEVAPIMEGVTQAVAGTGKAVTTEFQAAGEEIDKTKESLNSLLAQAKAVIDEVTTGEDVDAQKARDKNTAARIKESEQAQDLRSREIAKELEDRARLLEKQADAADAFRSREEAEHLRSQDRKKVAELRINAELLRNAEELANAKRRVAEAKSLATSDLRGNREGTVPDAQVETSLAAVRAAEEAEAQIRKLIGQRQEFLAKTQAGALEGEINLSKETIRIQEGTVKESIRLSEQANQSILQGRTKVVEEFITLQEREEEERRRFAERQAAINAAELAKQITAEKAQEERIQNDRLKRESDTQVKLRDAIISGRETLQARLLASERQLGDAKIQLDEAVAKQSILKSKGEREELIAAQEKVVAAARNAADRRQQIVTELNAAIIQIEKDAALAIERIRQGQGSSAVSGFNAALKATTDNLTASTNSAKGLSTALLQANNNFKAVEERGTAVQRFFGSFGKNLAESAGTIVKFRIGWELTSAAINAALLPAKLLVDAIKDGISFSIELQQKVADIREVLVQNVTFSSDLATNFELAGKAAEFLAIEQERSAAKIGIAADKFRSVFESFAQTGGIKAVQEVGETTEETLTKATRSTALLIAALNSVGVSSKDVRRQTTEIGKLLEGEVTQRDRIRIASGLTVEELNKQSLEAQRTGRFLQFVEKLFGAQVLRIATANERFTELNTNVRFFINRLQGTLVQPVFDKIIKSLQEILKYLEDNDKALTQLAQSLGASFTLFFDTIVSVGRLLKELGDTLSSITTLVDSLAESFARLFSTLSDKEVQDGKLNIGFFRAQLVGWATDLALLNNALDTVITNIRILSEATKRLPTKAGRESLGLSREESADFLKLLDGETKARSDFARDSERIQLEINQTSGRLLRAKANNEKAEEERLLARLGELNQARIKLQEDRAKAEKEFTKKQDAEETRNFKLFLDRELRESAARKQANFLQASKTLPANADPEVAPLAPFLAGDKDRTTDNNKELKFNNDRLNALNEQFRTALQTRKNIFEESIAETKRIEEERGISEAGASQAIREDLELEGKSVRNLAEHYIALANSLAESDPKLRTKFAETARRQVEEVVSNTRKAIDKQGQDDAKLRAKLAQEEFNFEKQLALKQAEEEISLAREAADQLRITKSEALQIEINQEERAHAIRLQINADELRSARESEEAKQKVRNAKFLLEQDHEKKRQVLRSKFFQQQEEEATELRRLGIDGLAVEREALEQRIQLQEQGFTTDQQRLNNLQRLTAASAQLAAANLAEAETELRSLEARRATNEALIRQQNLVEQLSNAKIRADAEEFAAQRRASRSGFSRIIDNVVGRDRSQDDNNALRNALKREIDRIKRQLQELQLPRTTVNSLEKQLTNLTKEFNRLNSEAAKVKFTRLVQDLESAINRIANSIDQVIAGFQQDGVLGGISGGLAAAAQFIPEPITRAVVSIASTVTGVLGRIFTALARRLAEQIRKSVENIVDNLNDGSITLGNAVAALEAQRLRAIQELSGKKGGNKELDKLLPDIERQIKTLVKQQEEVRQSFREELNQLRLGNDELADFATKWTEINLRVKEFLGSFKDGEELIRAQGEAAEFLSLKLKEIRDDAIDQLAEGERQAIDNALELLDLFEQRKSLIEDMTRAQEEFNRAFFDAVNGAAIERRQSGAVRQGLEAARLKSEFEQQKKQNEERLSNLNREIGLKSQIVSKEREAFNIARDKASLQKRSDELALLDADKLIEKYNTLKGIISGIILNSGGQFAVSPGLLGSVGAGSSITVGDINVVVQSNAPILNPEQVGSEIAEQIRRQARMGFALA